MRNIDEIHKSARCPSQAPGKHSLRDAGTRNRKGDGWERKQPAGMEGKSYTTYLSFVNVCREGKEQGWREMDGIYKSERWEDLLWARDSFVPFNAHTI